MDRDDIHIISRNSNWSDKGIDKELKERIYSDAHSWKKFLKLLLMSLGVGFTVSGILFFFAYNWTDLHKFIKMGIIEALIIASTSLILFSKIDLNTKNIILTGTAVMVGILMAVFGQVYQTGANAYDFFLGWTLAITLWVIVSNYAPLWFLYIVLANTTAVLYFIQVASNWPDAWSGLLFFDGLFVINTAALVLALSLPKIDKRYRSPAWFTNILTLALVTYSTIGIIIRIFTNDSDTDSILPLSIITVVAFVSGIIYGLKARNRLFLSVIPFSIVVIISALLLKLSDDYTMFFIISLFIILSITLLIIGLINIQKKWNNEEQK